MNKLYERLLELLHNKPGSLVVRKFLREIPEAPIIEKLGSIHSYLFPQHGFHFDFDPCIGYIWCICLYLEKTSGVEVFYLDYHPFFDELPYQIRSGDTRKTVQRKLSRLPDSSSNEPSPTKVPDIYGEALRKWGSEQAKAPMVFHLDTYHAPPLSFVYKFRITDGKLTSLNIFLFDG